MQCLETVFIPHDIYCDCYITHLRFFSCIQMELTHMFMTDLSRPNIWILFRKITKLLTCLYPTPHLSLHHACILPLLLVRSPVALLAPCYLFLPTSQRGTDPPSPYICKDHVAGLDDICTLRRLIRCLLARCSRSVTESFIVGKTIHVQAGGIWKRAHILRTLYIDRAWQFGTIA